MTPKRDSDRAAPHDILAAEAFAVGGADPNLHRQPPPHDILAAEAFAMPAADPQLHREPAHDVLAADEFAVPAADPALHHGPVTLPDDPSGIAEAHDVLAAEEFAMPAPSQPVGTGRPSASSGAGSAGLSSRRRLALAGGLTVVALLLRRARRPR